MTNTVISGVPIMWAIDSFLRHGASALEHYNTLGVVRQRLVEDKAVVYLRTLTNPDGELKLA